MLSLTLLVGLFASIFLLSEAQQKTQGNFNCKGRTTGYYADIESGCQVYHMCDGLGRQFSYTCPNATLFQQRMLICDHWYMVNCSKAIEDYSANELIGQQDKKFVEDSATYRRTPRPDLLHQPSASEYDIIYRTGNRRNQTNIIGASVENNTVAATNQGNYSPPSRWSTQNAATSAEPRFFQTNYGEANKLRGKAIEQNTNTNHRNSNVDSKTKTGANHFQPPVRQPQLKPFERTTANPIKVNFQSNFSATTPVYPTSVEATSQNPSEVGLLPPQANAGNVGNTNQGTINAQVPKLSLEIVPPPKSEDFTARNHTESSSDPPSKFYQPPKFEPDYTAQTNPINNGENSSKDNINRRTANAINFGDWQNLRRKFLIPEYDFPLDAATRPSYESELDSFQQKAQRHR